MKIAPLKVSDPWYGRIVNDESIASDSLSGVPIESTVEMELVELLHGGPEANYRPYLHLRGELTEAKPAVELPYGVSELALRQGAGLTVDAFYDFNQQQLADLVNKGYFTEAFQVPEQMSGIPWTLPGHADFLIVAPELSNEPPLVFMNVQDQNSLELNELNSGYELSGYFPDYSDEVQAQAPEVSSAEREHGGSGLDVFEDLSFEEPSIAVPAPVTPNEDTIDGFRAVVPDGVFSRLVSEIEARQPAPVERQAEEETVQPGVVPGSATDVYLSRVAPGVDSVLAGEHLDEEEAEQNADAVPDEDEVADLDSITIPVTADGFLDLDDPEPELAPLNLQFGETPDDHHREAAQRRAALLRAELANEETPEAGGEAQPFI